MDPEYSYPLSPMQQGMLFHHLYAQQPGVDIQQIVCSLHENLNAPAFERAWQRVIERHAVLRTSFRWRGLDEPLQEVHLHVILPLEQQDWRGFLQTEQENRLEDYVRADRQRGFDLAKAPLLRLGLFRMGEADYRFVWTFHHALVDGRSVPLVLREVFAFYEAFDRGEALRLDAARPYRDYIDWLQQRDLSGAEAFWRRTLKGFTAPTPLVVGHTSREAPGRAQGHREQEIRLSVAATSALRSLAEQHELTLRTLCQGAWAVLLSRYSGEEDVAFGATRPCGRSALEGAESMVGIFINTVPMRVRVSPDVSLLPWLKELQSQHTALEAYEHTPLVKVQEWSDVPRGAPLFESILVFQDYRLDSVLKAQSGNWTNRDFRLLGETNYPLTLYGYAEPELILKIAHDPNRFDDATIARLLGHLKTLLEGMGTNLHQRLSALPLLTEAERHQVLVMWNATRAEYPQDKCIHQLFEEQAERTPDAVAAVFEEQQMTYQELNARANQLAHYLQKLHVGPETLVAICVERSLEMVVGVLGILKAGGAYLPLDPTYPRERLAFLLEDTQARVLLTQQRLVADLPEHGARVVCLDTDWPSISLESKQTVTTMTTVAHLAYVIYTSGTTGSPKGVMVEHGNLCHYVHAMRRALDITANDRYLHTASIGFSSSVRQLMLPLSRGAAVVIASSERMADPVSLFEMVKLRNVSVIDIVPSYWRNCTDTLIRLAPESGARLRDNNLRLILSASEALWSDVPRNWTFGFGHGARLVNMFGQTETTGIVSVFPIPAKDERRLGVVPIGRPIANTQIYLLDQELRPVPVGVAGEVYIGGRGVGRGYLNRPELTAEKFIPDPVSGEPGGRLYKTGDLARYQPSGDMEFLGRSDNQLKIRGYRVEPGEIEAVLGLHAAVRESVVLAREDVPGDKRLVAYVVVEGRQAPTAGELRSLLKEKLPGYMVPSAFVLLDALPLTPNGKVDRGALLMPEATRPELERQYVAPRDSLERKLAKIWERVIRVQPVGVRDNFFDLGGHSLLAVRLFAQIENFMGKKLPLVTLFQAPTVEQLAAILRQEGWSPPWSSLVAIQPAGSRPPFYCVHAVGGNILDYRDLGRLLAPDQPVYGLQSQGLDGKDTPRTRLEDMAAHYIQEMRAFQPEGPYFLGGLSFGGLLAFQMAQQLDAEGQRVALLALFDTYNPVYELSLSAEIGFLGRQIRFHLGNLLRLGPKERLSYFRQKKRTVLRRIRSRIWQMNYRFYEAIRHPLPRSLQKVHEANRQAARQYVPRVYPGRVTLFRTSERGLERFGDPLLGWGELAAGGVEIHEVPGGHVTVLVEPHVRALAEQLKACLRKAQAGEPVKQVGSAVYSRGPGVAPSLSN